VSKSSTGHTILSALYKATTITCLDLGDTQLDYAKMRQCAELCARNKQAIEDAVPQRLEREIELLRNEQLRLRKAEATLLVYRQSIEKTEVCIQLHSLHFFHCSTFFLLFFIFPYVGNDPRH
jgi:hypothetical protein